MKFGIVSIQILRVTLGINHCSMEISRTKAVLIKSVFLAVGIPLAISSASLILEKIRARKISDSKSSPSHVHVNTLEINSPERDSHELLTLENSQLRNLGKDEIFGLQSKVEGLQERELMMEASFLCYHELKVQEFVLMEVEYNLLMELARAEFIDMEVSSKEDNQLFEGMVKEILNTLDELESSRSENAVLHPRIKLLMKRLKGYMHNISKVHNSRFEEMEAVIASKDTELVRKSDIIKKLEEEMEELRIAIKSLLEENNELLKKLEIAESLALTMKSEKETMKDYDQVVNELEQLQKDRAAETKELIYLRWCNACLKHKLFRMNQEQGVKPEVKKIEPEESEFGTASGEMSEFGFENESNCSVLAHVDQSVDPGISFNNRGSNGHPKRRNLYEKLKKWASKNKMEERKKPELKFFGSHFVANCGD